MSIVTKTGDEGQTGLFGGSRTSKASARLHAYGSVDELNAVLGLILAEPDVPKELATPLRRTQHLLFRAGADLATPVESPVRVHRMETKHIEELERWITDWEEALPAQTSFILPAGSRIASLLHLARTVCRRAERWIVGLKTETTVHPEVLIYLNRLSDALFLMARRANMLSKTPEEPAVYD